MSSLAALPECRLRQLHSLLIQWHLTTNRQEHVAECNVVGPPVLGRGRLESFQHLNRYVDSRCPISTRRGRLESAGIQQRVARYDIRLDPAILA